MSDVEAILDARAEDLRAIDNMILGDAAGVAQASDQLRETLNAIRTALDERRFEAAAALG
ncbi:hypothetical protein [Jannaschia rubra]|uniref:Uncharacterized protein n=1 Tax=Jannaschia rubra TaxID=282197 RepID=A0A0M6XQZ1_9RHOB|nr:hypothetical protein [Jannaschia rubra]CTQ33122.1 hypothetical protein JAN5088_01902 [Jannaschia rubra]SFG83548.1 hypothetical protein SAMN04488517_12115 [Jannaschia rubra]